MPVAIGQNISMRFKGRVINAEVIETQLMNPGDRHSHSKRDSNPIYKVTVRIPELKLLLSPQVEVTDSNVSVDEKLKDLITSELAHGHGQPYNH